MTPTWPAEFILAKTLPFFLIGLADVILIRLFSTRWIGIPFRGSLTVLLAGTMPFLACMVGVGLSLSTVSATQQQAVVRAFFFLMPAITFFGFGFLIRSMPPALQKVTCVDPLRYLLVVLCGSYLKGVGLAELWRQVAAMAAIGIVIFPSASAASTRRSTRTRLLASRIRCPDSDN